MVRRHPSSLLLGSVAVLFSLVSCARQDDSTPKLLQQLAILGDEIRTANREIRLLRQEVGELRQQTGSASARDAGAGVATSGPCVGEGTQCRPPHAESKAERKSGLPPPPEGERDQASKPQASNRHRGGPEGQS